jgi:uncharacterized protein DUF2848
MHDVTFHIDGVARRLGIEQLVIAGWTGRNRDAVERHIDELAAIGVRRPRAIPCFYRVGTGLLTTADDVEVVGRESTGEVEFVLVSVADGLYVGVGSDHTDRKVEAYGVTVSKQMCPKPIGPELWRLADVAPHWDRLILRSTVTRSAHDTLYQEGPVTMMLAPSDLIAKFPDSPGALPSGTVMFCGTLPVKDAMSFGDRFTLELIDPVRHRTLSHAYDVRNLTIAESSDEKPIEDGVPDDQPL